MSDTTQTNNINKSYVNRPIKILPPQLANQIAAGEVVERPASVVKELVENSLDAGATHIQIEIEQGGQKRILIRDNGKGISKDQLMLALSRHATSKISNIDDLEHITSMGFRGEALASISSVSRLTLTSKPLEQPEAWQAHAEGQQMDVQIRPAAHPDGTSIEVLDLFFNTPARRKFLRTGKTEFQHIEQIIKRIALTRPDVQFILSHNQKVCCRYASVNELSKRVDQVCGKTMLSNSSPIDYVFEDISLKGWCSNLGIGAATRDLQYTFVNGRMMKDKLLAHALRQVYEDTLPPQTFASYVLYLQVPPNQIDVNVHPAKHEVRFHQARQIHDLVFKAVTNGLSSENGNGFVNEEAESLNHNYIKPLNPENPHKHTYKNGMHNSPYRGNTPSNKQIEASNEFYAGLTPSIADTQKSLEANTKPLFTGNSQINSQLQGVNNYIYTSPYIIFGEAEKLNVLHIQAVINILVELRLSRSTLAQPLLMPVSIENVGQIKQVNLDALESLHFKLNATHHKLILKQVPSELRQLPWASVFSGLDLKELSNNPVEVSAIAQQIALAWFNTLDISESMLDGWLIELGPADIAKLIAKNAKTLHIDSWMKDE